MKRFAYCIAVAILIATSSGCFKPPKEVNAALSSEEKAYQATISGLEKTINLLCDCYRQAKYAQIDAATAVDRTAGDVAVTKADAAVIAHAQDLAKTDAAGAIALLGSNATVRNQQAADYALRVTKANSDKKSAVDAQIAKIQALVPLAKQSSANAERINEALQAWTNTGMSAEQIDAALQQILATAQQLLPKSTTTSATTTAKAVVVPNPQ